MTNSNQKERFRTKIAMLEQNNQVLRNKCEEYLGELADTKKKLDEIKSDIDEMIAESHDIGERFAEVVLCNLKNKINNNNHFADASKKINQKEQ